MAGTAPWKRGEGWVRNEISEVVVEAAGDAEVLDIRAGKRCGFLPPIFRREVEIFGADEIADAAALVGFVDAGPEAVEFL